MSKNSDDQKREQIEALYQHLDDFAVLVATNRARLRWLESTEAAVGRAARTRDEKKREAVLYAGVVLDRHAQHVRRQLRVYEHYHQDLAARLAKESAGQ